MNFSEVLVLIPSHSLEDFPSELSEKPAASLLNIFAVAWHPSILLETQTLPQWILTNLSRGDQQPIVNVVATAVMLLSVIPVWLAQRLTGETGGLTGGAR